MQEVNSLCTDSRALGADIQYIIIEPSSLELTSRGFLILREVRVVSLILKRRSTDAIARFNYIILGGAKTF